jgi:hypothetical protein
VANHQVDVYGLFHGEPTAAAPVITPDGGTFSASESVKLTSATASADIYYTLDGSVPTPASTLYKEPITITTDTTLNAVASATGYVQSSVSSAKFTISDQTPTVTFSPVAGTYATAQKVTLSDTDKTAKIYYTTNGATPTTSSTLYSGPITVGASITIKAIAVGLKLNSNVATAAYVIQASGTSINFANGFSSVAGLTQAGSVFWDQPIGVGSFTTSFTFQLSDALADGITFTIQNIGPKALGGSGAALGYAPIKKSVAIKFDIYSNAGEGTDSTGVYTDGATPTVPAVNMTSSGVILRSGDAMVANITYNGTTLTMKLTDAVTKKIFTLSKAINIPSVVGADKAYVGFTGSTGGLTASQKIASWTYNVK